MTNFEMMISKMTKNSKTPYFSILCGYWMGRHGCTACPMWHWCDCDPMPSDEQMEEWLKKEVE